MWKIRRFLLLATLSFITFNTGCTVFHQPGSDATPIYSKIFRTDYNTAWQATLEALKSFDRTVVNRESGIIQTVWIDNTAQKNLMESVGGTDVYLKAKYRLNVSIAPGTYRGLSSVKISIQKEQVIQRDILEGWMNVKTDSIEENTMLYRIGRVIYVKHRLKDMEDQKTRELLNEAENAVSSVEVSDPDAQLDK